jgi:hypothetical protein
MRHRRDWAPDAANNKSLPNPSKTITVRHAYVTASSSVRE